MTLLNNDLYSESTRAGLPAIQPARGPGSVVPRTFTAAADTLPVGTPVCVVPATGFMDICDPDEGSNAWETEVYGFVWPAAIVRSGSAEVIGTVMMKGSIAYSVVLALLTQLTGTEQQLANMLRKPAVQEGGLFIDGLTRAGGNAGLAFP
jgi:hypothetical protein